MIDAPTQAEIESISSELMDCFEHEARNNDLFQRAAHMIARLELAWLAARAK